MPEERPPEVHRWPFHSGTAQGARRRGTPNALPPDYTIEGQQGNVEQTVRLQVFTQA
jgi:hypothetical protein